MAVRILTAVAATATLLPLLAGLGVATPDTHSELAAVRRATAVYHDLDRALADGYALASGCVPNMGFHYVNSIAAGPEELDPITPNMLVYAPEPDGGLRLVAVEYASWTPASMFGQTFEPTGSGGPPFHTLHAWIWQGNRNGVFAARNPSISCE